MAQLTVFRNKSARTRSTFPFLVEVQTDLLEDLQTRVVIPLTKATALKGKPVSQLTPVLPFDGETYVLMTPELAGVARADLGPAAGNLAAHRDTILAAIDFLLTGF